MQYDVNVFWTFLGILIWPQLTLAVILWQLKHPILAIIALFATWNNATQIVRTRYIDSRGRVVAEVQD